MLLRDRSTRQIAGVVEGQLAAYRFHFITLEIRDISH